MGALSDGGPSRRTSGVLIHLVAHAARAGAHSAGQVGSGRAVEPLPLQSQRVHLQSDA